MATRSASSDGDGDGSRGAKLEGGVLGGLIAGSVAAATRDVSRRSAAVIAGACAWNGGCGVRARRSQQCGFATGAAQRLSLRSLVSIVTISALNKTYASGFVALKNIDLEIRRGEILALLGPNGAGKTTLINIICGIVTQTSGRVVADGHDIVRDYRRARASIGLVPQELSTDAFETVWATVRFSRGLFGKPSNPAHLEKTLRALSLWDKRDSKIMTLSGGMKRRVLIAKALSHEPSILFLDEPTAGVDVELRHEMWSMVRRLRESGVTIILTTHYIEEAQAMADRVGVINKGELLLVEDKEALMRKLGKRKLVVELAAPLDRVPDALATYALEVDAGRRTLTLTFDAQARAPMGTLLAELGKAGIEIADIHTSETSLEDIFVDLVREAA
jgi:ABC-2 type transport system ATP-binding protein